MYNKEYFAKLRAKRKELGLCSACGKHPIPCEPCRKRNRERIRKVRSGIPIEERQKTWKTNRDYFLKRKFGIDTRHYAEMLIAQNGLCAICGRPDSGDKRTNNFAVDHCHDSGVVRGLLCASCNKGLGMFNDSVESLSNAIKYLQKHLKKTKPPAYD